jgi:hypothetical protein
MRAQPQPYRSSAGRSLATAAIAAVLLVTTVAIAVTVIRSLTRQPSPKAQPAAAPATTTGAAAAETGAPCAGGGQEVKVANAAQLARALASARAGQVIRMADGTYKGEFHIAASGSAGQPIMLCGSRRAVLRGQAASDGYGLYLDGARFWILSGFSVTGTQKGVVLDRSSSNRLTGLLVSGTGQEGVHFRAFSSDNVLERSEIRDTGLETPKFGEGVYVGSAVSNWCEYTACKPDASDRNQVLDNRIGPNTSAEAIDVKEGTSGGTIRGNVISGQGMKQADSWLDVKGNRWTISHNTGSIAPEDGFQVHVIRAGWGRDNVFDDNVANLGDGEYGFRIDSEATGTVVGCNNQVTGASKGRSNVACR